MAVEAAADEFDLGKTARLSFLLGLRKDAFEEEERVLFD